MRSLSIAATGMLAQQLNVEVISNNIANMNTTGYKRRRAEFQDLLYQNERRVGSTSSDTGTVMPSGVQIGLGVKTAAVYLIAAQGNLTPTENNFDLAISGNGFSRSSCRAATPPTLAPALSRSARMARLSPPTDTPSSPRSPFLQTPSA